ncbi:hypothetical protein PVL29_019539 [Vitis rotundifolia]|uniref:Integrase catalytic domain-containing protein n=1 Tax=Vitis rotundifolia TaxID=103349 RepID=A0AA39DFG8_VITRO|nr:hypothetical protein PVL29_019539 [Vitis rotundifolia]
MEASLVHTRPNISKIDPFNGTFFKRWQEKVFSAIDVVNLGHILTDPKPEDDSHLLPTWEIGNKQVRHVILSTLSKKLFDIYCQFKVAKEIWDAMNKKYILEDAGTQKYAIGNFRNFQMTEDRDTLPESWKDYKNNMKHKMKQMSLEDVIIHIRIEEQNRNRDNIEKAKELSSKANVVEDKPKPKNNRSRKQNSRTKPNASNKRIQKTNSKANLVETEVITTAISSEVSMVTNMKDWVVDSGATRHICGNRSAFTSYTTVKEGEEQVFMGDSRSTPMIGKRKVLLKLTSGKVLALCDVLHVPDIHWNLVSVSLLRKTGVRILFDSDKIVLTKNDAFVGKGYCNQGLFLLNVSDIINNNASSSSAYIVDSCDIWHGRLGHVNFSYMKRIVKLDLIPKLSLKNHEKCESCVESKTTKKSCKSVERESNLLSLIHSDLGDLKNTMTKGGKRFYITFIDDYLRYTRVYLLRNQDEAKDAFIKYKIEVENQLSKKIKRLRTDREGEYESNPFNSFCEDHGIIHETTSPYSPKSNGVAEKKNKTLKDMMNAMLVSSGAPLNLWGEAILSACHIQNRIPYKKTGKTPYELWKGYAPNIAYLKVWGCLAKFFLPEPKK